MFISAEVQHSTCPRSDTLNQFVLYARAKGVELNETQLSVARVHFSQPKGSGKSTLIALLLGYDVSAQIYDEQWIHGSNSHFAVDAASCLTHIRSSLHELQQRGARGDVLDFLTFVTIRHQRIESGVFRQGRRALKNQLSENG
jgi:hypothetical protein